MTSTKDKVNLWHEEAMDLAEMALFAKKRGELYNYWKFIQRALNFEKAAARLINDNHELEPSRSVLYKGAIHLAINLDHFDEARQLIQEAIEGNPPEEIKIELETLNSELDRRETIRSRTIAQAQGFLENSELTTDDISRALRASIAAVEIFYGKETINQLLNRISLEVSLESKNLVTNPDYLIFQEEFIDSKWLKEKKSRVSWNFWKAYKIYLDKKNFASTTIKKLDDLTDDILSRIGDPSKSGVWNKRGMIVGDVQSGKTSNYIGLINKAADLGFRIIIVLSGLYENLRQQTQQRVDEGFIGEVSDINSPNAGQPIGVELYRQPKKLPIHPITKAGEAGDLKKATLPNSPINTNDYYALVIKKNPTVLTTLLKWLYARADNDGDYKIIKNRPLLIIDDEADYASINVDKEFVSKINGCIRATLSLFEQSAFIGYTATPFANVFISDINETEGREIVIDQKRFRLGEDLFPKDFIINLRPPSNYIGYSQVFNTVLKAEEGENNDAELPMINIINDFEKDIPKGHRRNDDLPTDIPTSLKNAIKYFIIVCATRRARSQQKEHNSMLVHVSWYVKWIDRIAFLVNAYLDETKMRIRNGDSEVIADIQSLWEKEFKNKSKKIVEQLDYDDPNLINHDWDEIEQYLMRATDKIEVRAVHGVMANLEYNNVAALDYAEHKMGLSVIAIGGNKLSRGLTLEGLSISYFLRASRFYDTLLQMGRWFGYRQGYSDLCRLFTTEELVGWYQHIGKATEELKEQFDIIELADRTPEKFGLKVRSAPGMLMISSAAKIKGATDLSLSFSGDLQETYVLSKSEDILQHNISCLNNLLERLGDPSNKKRQEQRFIWENVNYHQLDRFIADYKITQFNIHPDFLRGYIGSQLRNGDLNNWTVVVISNIKAKEYFSIHTSLHSFEIGYTLRTEVEETDAFGNTFTDRTKYRIRKSHIISPPHEYLDMEETDDRYVRALEETKRESKAINIPIIPSGKFIRKHRGRRSALLLIYVLDPIGFGGKPRLPAIGFAISFPEIENDEKIPYKVNQQFIEERFAIPKEAEENPEEEYEEELNF